MAESECAFKLDDHKTDGERPRSQFWGTFSYLSDPGMRRPVIEPAGFLLNSFSHRSSDKTFKKI